MSETSGFVYDMTRIVADNSFPVLETIGSGGKFVLFDGSGQLRRAQAFTSGRMPAVGFVTAEAASGTLPIVTFLGKLIKDPNIIGAGGDPPQFQEFVGASGGIATFYDGSTNLEAGPVQGAAPDAGSPLLAVDQSATIQAASGLAYLLKHPEKMKRVDDNALFSYSPGDVTMPPVIVRDFGNLMELPAAAVAGQHLRVVLFCSGGSNVNTRLAIATQGVASGFQPAVAVTLNAQADPTPVSGGSSFIASKVVRAYAAPISGVGPVGGRIYVGQVTAAATKGALGVISNGFLSGGLGTVIQPVGVVIASGGYAVINIKPICLTGYAFPYT